MIYKSCPWVFAVEQGTLGHQDRIPRLQNRMMKCLFTYERVEFLWCCHSYDKNRTEAVGGGGLSHFWPLTLTHRRHTTATYRRPSLPVLRKTLQSSFFLLYFFDRNFILFPENKKEDSYKMLIHQMPIIGIRLTQTFQKPVDPPVFILMDGFQVLLHPQLKKPCEKTRMTGLVRNIDVNKNRQCITTPRKDSFIYLFF